MTKTPKIAIRLTEAQWLAASETRYVDGIDMEALSHYITDTLVYRKYRNEGNDDD